MGPVSRVPPLLSSEFGLLSFPSDERKEPILLGIDIGRHATANVRRGIIELLRAARPTQPARRSRGDFVDGARRLFYLRPLFLAREQLPPLDWLRRHGVRIAISTDCNPGSSPALSLLLMMNMACTLFRMTPAETLAGVTKHPAAALGLGATHGQLRAGYAADLAIWDIAQPAELSYWLGGNPCAGVVQAGRWRDKKLSA